MRMESHIPNVNFHTIFWRPEKRIPTYINIIYLLRQKFLSVMRKSLLICVFILLFLAASFATFTETKPTVRDITPPQLIAETYRCQYNPNAERIELCDAEQLGYRILSDVDGMLTPGIPDGEVTYMVAEPMTQPILEDTLRMGKEMGFFENIGAVYESEQPGAIVGNQLIFPESHSPNFGCGIVRVIYTKRQMKGTPHRAVHMQLQWEPAYWCEEDSPHYFIKLMNYDETLRQQELGTEHYALDNLGGELLIKDLLAMDDVNPPEILGYDLGRFAVRLPQYPSNQKTLVLYHNCLSDECPKEVRPWVQNALEENDVVGYYTITEPGSGQKQVFLGLAYDTELPDIDERKEAFLRCMTDYWINGNDIFLDGRMGNTRRLLTDFFQECAGPIYIPEKRAEPPGKDDEAAFLISDVYWEDVIELVPLAIYTDENGIIHNRPILIYHREENRFDADSIVHFLQQYRPDRLHIVEHTPQDTPPELINLLTAPFDPITSSGGARLSGKGDIGVITPADYLSSELFPHRGAETINEFVIVNHFEENAYENSMMAAVYASYKHAPLLILDPAEADAHKAEYDGLFEEKELTIVEDGDELKAIFGYYTNTFTLSELQKEYVELTGTDKVIMANPDDIYEWLALYKPGGDIEVRESIEEDPPLIAERGGGTSHMLYYKTSLIAPILAAAKHEVIITTHSSEYMEIDEEFTEQLFDIFDVKLRAPKAPEVEKSDYSHTCEPLKDKSCLKGYTEETVSTKEVKAYTGNRLEISHPIDEDIASILASEPGSDDKYVVELTGEIYCEDEFRMPTLRINGVEMEPIDYSRSTPGEDLKYGPYEGMRCGRSVGKIERNGFIFNYRFSSVAATGKEIKVELDFERRGTNLAFEVVQLDLDHQPVFHGEGDTQTKRKSLLRCGDKPRLDSIRPYQYIGLLLEDCFGKPPGTVSIRYLETPEHIASGSEVTLKVEDAEKPHMLTLEGVNGRGENFIISVYLKRWWGFSRTPIFKSLILSDTIKECIPIPGGVLKKGMNTIVIEYWSASSVEEAAEGGEEIEQVAPMLYKMTLTEVGQVSGSVKHDKDERPGEGKLSHLTIMASPIAIAQAAQFGSGSCSMETDNRLYGNLLNDQDVDLGVGRIYGITASDVSSLAARTLTFDVIQPTQKRALFIMIGTIHSSKEKINAKEKINEDFEGSYWWETEIWGDFDGYEECYGRDECRHKKDDAVREAYRESQLILYNDHGNPYSLEPIFYENLKEMRTLKSPIIFTRGCNTGAFKTKDAALLFPAQNIRRGAIGYYGASSYSRAWPFNPILDVVYVGEGTLGDGLKAAKNADEVTSWASGGGAYHYILLGDPTLRPKTKEGV
jgi:hypothetical protein